MRCGACGPSTASRWGLCGRWEPVPAQLCGLLPVPSPRLVRRRAWLRRGAPPVSPRSAKPGAFALPCQGCFASTAVEGQQGSMSGHGKPLFAPSSSPPHPPGWFYDTRWECTLQQLRGSLAPGASLVGLLSCYSAHLWVGVGRPEVVTCSSRSEPTFDGFVRPLW